MRICAASSKANHIVYLYLAAGPNAQATLDTGIHIHRDGRMAAIWLWGEFGGKPASFDILLGGIFPQLGFGIMCHISVRLIGYQQFHNHFARSFGPMVLAVDDHAGRRSANAGGCKYPLTLNFNHTGAAIAIRPISSIVLITKMRDVRAKARRGLPDGLAILCRDLFAIKRKADIFCRHNAPDERLLALLHLFRVTNIFWKMFHHCH
jgi:hypothetical protein